MIRKSKDKLEALQVSSSLAALFYRLYSANLFHLSGSSDRDRTSLHSNENFSNVYISPTSGMIIILTDWMYE